MQHALLKTFTALFTPFFWGKVFQCVLLSLLAITLLSVIVGWVLAVVPLPEDSWFSGVAAGFAGAGLSMLMGYFLFPTLMPAIAGLFFEPVARHIDQKDYQIDTPKHKTTMQEAFLSGLRFMLVAVMLNLIALPLYLIPLVNLAIFYALNGYLLGRQYWELAAMRHLPLEQARAIRKKEGGTLWIAGFIIVALATIPLVNLVTPILASILFVHLVQKISKHPVG